MARLRISRRAGFDLESIQQYSVKKWGKCVADEYLDSIDHALARLQEHPDLLSGKAEISARFKFYRVKQHFLVCDVIGGNIYIIAIMHCSMDLPTRIEELEPYLIQEAELLHKAFVKSEKRRGSRKEKKYKKK